LLPQILYSLVEASNCALVDTAYTDTVLVGKQTLVFSKTVLFVVYPQICIHYHGKFL